MSVSITISLSISISVSISGYFGFINNLLVFLITFWFHKPCRGRRPRRPAYGTSQRINNHTLSNAGLEPAFKCSLRLVLTFTLYLCATLVSYANSSLLTETLYSSSFSTDINASCGTDTDPSCLIRFFPSFCFSNSFFFLVISPP